MSVLYFVSMQYSQTTQQENHADPNIIKSYQISSNISNIEPIFTKLHLS